MNEGGLGPYRRRARTAWRLVEGHRRTSLKQATRCDLPNPGRCLSTPTERTRCQVVYSGLFTWPAVEWATQIQLIDPTRVGV